MNSNFDIPDPFELDKIKFSNLLINKDINETDTENLKDMSSWHLIEVKTKNSNFKLGYLGLEQKIFRNHFVIYVLKVIDEITIENINSLFWKINTLEVGDKTETIFINYKMVDYQSEILMDNGLMSTFPKGSVNGLWNIETNGITELVFSSNDDSLNPRSSSLKNRFFTFVLSPDLSVNQEGLKVKTDTGKTFDLFLSYQKTLVFIEEESKTIEKDSNLIFEFKNVYDDYKQNKIVINFNRKGDNVLQNQYFTNKFSQLLETIVTKIDINKEFEQYKFAFIFFLTCIFVFLTIILLSLSKKRNFN